MANMLTVASEGCIKKYTIAAEELLLKAKPEDGLLTMTLLASVRDACLTQAVIGEIELESLDQETVERFQFILFAIDTLSVGAYGMLPMILSEYREASKRFHPTFDDVIQE